MTNKQKEAIEELKSLSPSEGAIDIVLSLIKEQEEEIAKYEKIYKEYDCYRWVKELNKKDKQIDLMARAIDNYDSQLEINTFKDKEYIKQYFADLVEKEN